MARRHFTLCLFMLIHIAFFKVFVFVFVTSGKKKRSVFKAYRCEQCVFIGWNSSGFLTPCKITFDDGFSRKRRCFYLRVKEQALTRVLFLWF
jgi:hypothetical protein